MYCSKFVIIISAIQIMCIHIIPASIAVIFESKLLGQLRTKYVLTGRLAALVIMIMGMITLGSIYDIIGIAISLVISSIGLCLIFFVGIRRLTVSESNN